MLEKKACLKGNGLYGTEDLVLTVFILKEGTHFFISGLVRLREILWKILSERKSALFARGGHPRSNSSLICEVYGRAPVQSLAALYWTLDNIASCVCFNEWN